MTALAGWERCPEGIPVCHRVAGRTVVRYEDPARYPFRYSRVDRARWRRVRSALDHIARRKKKT